MQSRAQHAHRVGAKDLLDVKVGPHLLEGVDGRPEAP